MQLTASALTSVGQPDPHSYGNPHQIRVKDVKLDLAVDLDQERISGTATLLIERQPGCPANCPLVLDTRNLEILQVSTQAPFRRRQSAQFAVGFADPILGAPLVVQLSGDVNRVTIEYKTTKGSDALQWLPAREGRNKFLFTQGQAILTRTWIPLQDSPGVRITYSATIRVPEGVRAVMSAKPSSSRQANLYRFSMPYCIPPYLIALGVGDLVFRKLGKRTGVYAAPDVIESAAWEFAQAEEMMAAMEKRYGPYRWGRWDILVLPPSFPFGGMENPLLTFVTPTLLAGDRSLVSVIIHELAHSWSGNLVTNATWRDFYLNEGFTTYIERRILEDIFGIERAQLEVALGIDSLQDLLKKLKPADQILHIDLQGRDPDDGCNSIPYEKGSLLLRTLESLFGRERLDRFVRGYFDHFAFQSITTSQFEAYLKEHLLGQDLQTAAGFDLNAWLYEPGLPANHVQESCAKLALVEAEASAFAETKIVGTIAAEKWGSHEWQLFLRSVSANSAVSEQKLSAGDLTQLDARFHLTASGNCEILQEWFVICIACNYEPAVARIESFIRTVGRRKYITPLYKELMKTPAGAKRANELFQQSRSNYHPLLLGSVEKILRNEDVWD